MRKIANTMELQHELAQILAYAQSERPSRARIASDLDRLSSRLVATEEPNIGLRQSAFNQARSIARNLEDNYGRPTQSAAQRYYDALDKTVSEEARFKLAVNVAESLEAEINFNKAHLKVMERIKSIFWDVAADHNRLSHVQ